MSNYESSPKSKYLWVYWVAVGIYAVGLVAFSYGAVNWDPAGIKLRATLAFAVIGPSFFYGFMYFVTTNEEERMFVKLLAQVWGPFWAAISALCFFWYNGL